MELLSLRGPSTEVSPDLTLSSALVEVEAFLELPLVARVANWTSSGPAIRPVWFLWEDGALWWLTGSSYSRLGHHIVHDPRVAVVIDTCDIDSGRVLAVTMDGDALVVPFEPDRATRKLTKYLGPDQRAWTERFTGVFDDPTSRFVMLKPAQAPRLQDHSFHRRDQA